MAVALAATAVILASIGVGAQEAEPPVASRTAEPTPLPTPPVEAEASDEPTSEAEAFDVAQGAAESSPTPTPGADPSGGADETTEEAPTVKTDEGEEISAVPERQFDLNAYPESAKMGPKQKWDNFRDGVRGLLVWDFFDSKLTIRAHARIQVDGTLAWGNDRAEEYTGGLNDSFDLRRLEAFAQGTIDHHLRYSLSFNFGADPGFGDIFIEGRDSGLNVFGYRIGQFRLGSFQEPFSFEKMMSSYYTGFLERALPVWTFTPGNNLGYMVHDVAKKGRMSWAVGFFSFGQQNEANASGSVLSITSRVTWLPVFRDEGRTLLHVGASFSTRDPQGSAIRYRSRPEARFAPFLADTGDIDAGRIMLGGLEAAGVMNRWSFQTEVIASKVTGTQVGEPIFWGGYVEVGWFLTGEHRSYDHELGVFSRSVPKDEYRGIFRKDPGGAIELVGRLSNVDLEDGGIDGGRMVDLSFGVNWYLSLTSAVKLNYIHSDAKDHGRANVIVLRYQFRPLPVPGWK